MENNQPNNKLAFVIDNVVVDIITTDERLAAIMLSNPTVLDITDMSPGQDGLYINSTYVPETNSFIPPQYDDEGNLIQTNATETQ